MHILQDFNYLFVKRHPKLWPHCVAFIGIANEGTGELLTTHKLTWTRHKMATLCNIQYFEKAFYGKKSLMFSFIKALIFCAQGSSQEQDSSGSGEGLSFIWHQAITWMNGDPDYEGYICDQRPALLTNSMSKSMLVYKDFKFGFGLAGSTATSQSKAIFVNCYEFDMNISQYCRPQASWKNGFMYISLATPNTNWPIHKNSWGICFLFSWGCR